ncbi:MAG TPA: hypothetical protein PKB14_11165 [Rubrivivax sp.]|nr:hypothetical protein [Rubrivivax sp.]
MTAGRRGALRTIACAGALRLPWIGSFGVTPVAGAEAPPAARGARSDVPVGGGGAYRPDHPYLFQSIGAPTYKSKLGGGDYNADIWGPTNLDVDAMVGWSWRHRGGDWLDAKLQSQGIAAWADWRSNAAASALPQTVDALDLTALVRYCQQRSRWLALLISNTGAALAVRGPFDSAATMPALNVTYVDGSHAVLRCRIVAASTPSSALPVSAARQSVLPCFVEFERPAKAVASASLALTVVKLVDGPARLDIFLCDPPINTQPLTTGLAERAGKLDEGMHALPGVIGVQRYVDGARLSDFVVAGAANHDSEALYDPALWGGRPDMRKWPHAAAGKWVNPPATGLSLVSSSFREDGFLPLSKGLGALRLEMPDSGVPVGGDVGYRGTLASNMKLFMPFEEFGRLSRIFVRYYMRLGTPYVRTPADRREVRQGSAARWSELGGKIGISAAHATTYGGVSGSSGGGFGWQMRHAWVDCDAAQGGPDEGGVVCGWHLYDFQRANPEGHRYGTESQNRNNWGQQGGLGGVLYAGRWYCIETEVKLNTVDTSATTFVPDGELRAWIDGRLAFERVGMVFRTLPLHAPPYSPNHLRPCRELGVKELWWNWFHGGTTQNTAQRTMFVTGLAWARERIGPIRL